MYCPNCGNEKDAGTPCAGCGDVNFISAERPTIVAGYGHVPGQSCESCGARNAPGWTSCFVCGASPGATGRSYRWVAALLAAMVGFLTFLTLWRLAHPVVYSCVLPPPAPEPMPTVEVRTAIYNTPGDRTIIFEQDYTPSATTTYVTHETTGQAYTTVVRQTSDATTGSATYETVVVSN